jgi:hypothetical protein
MSRPTFWKHGASSEAHLGLFGGEKKSQNKNFDDHIQPFLTSINSEIDRRDDGNVLVARELSDALRAKIRWGIMTP